MTPITTLASARAILRRNADSSLTGTTSHLEACAFIDGWAGVSLAWTIDAEQWTAWVLGRAEREVGR